MSFLTVVVPTFNRPLDLRRLLAFLLQSKPILPIVVLDSSQGDAAGQNVKFCGNNPGIVRQSYPSETKFYDKLCDGIRRHVKSPAICLCADDDFVIPQAIEQAARLIRDDTSVTVAHGYYAQFTLVGGSRVTNIAYCGGEITASAPFHRVAEGLLRYEASLYAVQRTDLLVRMLDEAAGAPNLLSAELLTSVLALAHGKSRRLSAFTHGRSIAPSHSYINLHPSETLSVDPHAFINGIAFVRGRLSAHVPDRTHSDLKLFDLAMLAYASDYIRPSTTRRIARMALDGCSDQELGEVGWSEFTSSLRAGVGLGSVRGSALGRWLKRRLSKYPRLRERAIRLARNGVAPASMLCAPASDGRAIAVKFESSFVRQLSRISCTLGDATTMQLAKAMALYSNNNNQL